MLILLVVSMIQYKYGGVPESTAERPCPQTEHVRTLISRQNYLFRLLLFVVLLIMVVCWGYYGSEFNAADFIYGRF